MTSYMASRLLQTVLVLMISSIALFAIIRVTPGDPAVLVAGENAPPEVIQEVRVRLGLTGSLTSQYLRWLGNAVKGDLGTSYLERKPVTDMLAKAVPASIELAFLALIVALAIGIPLGVLAATKPKSAWEYGLTGFAAFGIGVPSFYLGIIAILIFSVRLQLLPTSGRVPLLDDPIDGFTHLILPAGTLAMSSAALFSRFVQATLSKVLREDYIRTAHAKGLSSTRITFLHALPNAAVPLITIVSLQAGRLAAGAVITEQLFAWPGLGRLVIRAIDQRDYVLVQGALVVMVLTFVFVNLASDLLYGLFDPRIRR